MRQARLLLVLLCVSAFWIAPPAMYSQERCRLFPETHQQVCDRLLQYWEQNGGLSVFGLPIGEQHDQQLEGRFIQAQVFERNRLELHPENAPPYDVLLGRQGADALARAGRDWTSFAKATPGVAHYFAQTGHAIAPRFWDYWSSHGLEFDGQPGFSAAESLALFGLPLSESTMETNPTDGRQYLTQWFERARFEYHPENAGTPYSVLLGLLSAEQAAVPAASPPAYATQLVDLVNQKRAAAGCPALVLNDTLMRVALAHSQDMATHDFFDHIGSDGRTPYQRMQQAGFRYTRAAENVAAGVTSPVDVIALWMQSPGHRANLLNCDLHETGVGYVVDPGDPLNYGSYWTQDFGTSR